MLGLGPRFGLRAGLQGLQETSAGGTACPTSIYSDKIYSLKDYNGWHSS